MTLIDRFIRSLLLRHKNRGTLGSADSRRDFLRTMVMGGVLAPVVPGFVERIVVSSSRRSDMADLLRAMGRGAQAAMDAFAAFISAPILQVIEQAPVMSSLFGSDTYSLEADTTPRVTLSGPEMDAWLNRPRDPWDIS